ncbi:hypothetical protein RDV89_13925 [Nocardioides zeae]|uniref:DUF3040 domain-containing protein n=1 Tax=Nocardioides imazamoxiresistens TaxID=3231893 RepID=A0ABU3PY55_9ACTN|nr:hypothetical protein [Nocardioides zeae]MDT9594176.1 hypothetical protein [Nocardioides zeae]
MLSRDVEVVLPGRTRARVVERARAYEGRRWTGLWVRVDGDRVTARDLGGGRSMEDGVLRGRLLQEGDDVVIRGRMRWGNLVAFLGLWLVIGAAILAMAVHYGDGVIYLAACLPLGFAVLWVRWILGVREEHETRLRRRLQEAL